MPPRQQPEVNQPQQPDSESIFYVQVKALIQFMLHQSSLDQIIWHGVAPCK